MKFKSTTLVCIDCVNVKGAIRAMEKSLALCSFDDVKFFTSEETDYPHVKINKINNLAEYSLFAIKELWKHINTDYLLIVQHDGWILNPDAWDDAWYDLDYIGGNACWTDEMGGNGGFSFRTKKLMQECDKILTDPEKQYYNPEDVAISGHWDHCYRKTLIERGFKFATQKMQSTFGCDWGVWTGEFGHHKCDLKHLPQNESKKIKKAVYGSKEKNIDVTEIVRDLSGTIVVSNHIMQCDPHGGVVKDLTVWYENDNFETFKEGSYFDAGVIKRIKTKNIIKSTYGSEIKSVDVTEITRNLFDKLIGTPILNNHIMQCDPCYGIQKKIKIEFDDGTIEEVLEGGTIFNSCLNIDSNCEIVISRYDEDVSWIKELKNNKITIYNKLSGENLLQNVGRESHTFLHHIIANYENLSDEIVFTQAKPYDHCTKQEFFSVVNSKKSFFGVCERVEILPSIMPWGEGEKAETKKWWEELFPDREYEDVVKATFYGIFKVKKEQILKHSISFYEKAIKLGGLDKHCNPTVGHFFERIWMTIFTDEKKSEISKYVEMIRNEPIENLSDPMKLEELICRCGVYPTHHHQGLNFGGLQIHQLPSQFSKYLIYISKIPIENYMEIGVLHLGTFIFTIEYLRRFNNRIKGFAVDPNKSKQFGQYKRMNNNIEFLQCHSTSDYFHDFVSKNEIDLVFIDGDHSSDVSFQDFKICSKKSKVIAFHDICDNFQPGVCHTWNRVRALNPECVFFEIMDQYEKRPNIEEAWFGIGIVTLSRS